MSEVEKLYKNAGVKPYYNYIVLKECYNGKITFTKQAVCEKAQLFKNKKLRIIQVQPLYPDFTAEKQLSLIKWLARKGLIQINYSSHQCYQFNSFRVGGDYKTDISEALASHCNNLLQDLTESEQEQIRSILNG